MLQINKDESVQLKAKKDGSVVKDWKWATVSWDGEPAETEEEMDTLPITSISEGVTFAFECEEYSAIIAEC